MTECTSTTDGTAQISLIKRRRGVSRSDLLEMFGGTELAQAARSPGLSRYEQHVTLPGAYRVGEPPFDLIVESVSHGSDGARPTRPSGVLTFGFGATEMVDPDLSVTLIVGRSLVVKDGAERPGDLRCYALTHRGALERDIFFRHWAEVHGPIAREIPQLVRYVQHHAAAPVAAPGGRLAEGCAVTWFESVDAMREAATTPAYRATRADEPHFIDGEAPQVITAAGPRLP